MSMVLRKAEQRDDAAVNELATVLVGFGTDRRASFEATLASPDHDVIVAELDGAVIAYAHLMTYQDLSHGALAGELLGLVVRKDMRRRGIGTALLREIIRLATKRGIGELHINTEPDNEAARALYASLGAKMVGVQLEIDLASAAGQGGM